MCGLFSEQLFFFLFPIPFLFLSFFFRLCPVKKTSRKCRGIQIIIMEVVMPAGEAVPLLLPLVVVIGVHLLEAVVIGTLVVHHGVVMTQVPPIQPLNGIQVVVKTCSLMVILEVPLLQTIMEIVVVTMVMAAVIMEVVMIINLNPNVNLVQEIGIVQSK
ncbi:hypothetical protein BDA99DRAFT_33694 [Phascolomyces articulosus]|uniref:Uncharacterized protein n=1 Tax=Phascolomyces articulosus TaxID=60185 RepID=A0AAD5PFH6_9FUNG|nr:hypothetical protein BDA99DRAFT_33694 [Phascolomyces articulosus]